MGKHWLSLNIRCVFWTTVITSISLYAVLILLDSQGVFTSNSDVTISVPKQSNERHAAIFDYLRLMSSLNISTVLIEPYNLFCLLSPKDKQLLQKRLFRLPTITYSKDVINFALFGRDNFKLDSTVANEKIKIHGFGHWREERPVGSWFQKQSPRTEETVFTTHHFFLREHVIVHAVVFYERGDYLWHGRLDKVPHKVESIGANIGSLLFVNDDSAYERFSTQSLTGNKFPLLNLLIPSDPTHFLLQMLHSRFLDCGQNGLGVLNNSTLVPPNHGSALIKAFHISLQVLKKLLKPAQMNFCISGDTLLGWYKACILYSKVKELQFVAFASEIDFDDKPVFLEAVTGAKEFNISGRYELDNKQGFQLRLAHKEVNIELTYILGSDYNYCSKRLNSSDYYRYGNQFELCSADLLGQKVLVPC